jgi:small membrane protein
MLQQSIALLIILFFIVRLFILKKKGLLPAGEFIFWLAFWFLAGASVLSLKWIDELVAKFGFSASGINFLAYLAILILFYLVFRLRLKAEKMSKDITEVARIIAINNNKK